jgi:hypothetical protein
VLIQFHRIVNQKDIVNVVLDPQPAVFRCDLLTLHSFDPSAVVTQKEYRAIEGWYRIEDIYMEESRGERLPKGRKQIITSLRRPIDAWQIST